MKFEWEMIHKGIEGGTVRAKVWGGWLIILYEEENHRIVNKTATFIPDPNHQWEIEKS